jgi:hypothetical protein
VTTAKTARPSRGGRPAIGPQINVAISPATVARIDAAARVDGIGRSEWIRRAVEAAL